MFDAVVMPRAGLFEAPGLSPSNTDIALAQIRSGPRPVAKTDLTFATVESNVSKIYQLLISCLIVMLFSFFLSFFFLLRFLGMEFQVC